MNVKRLSGAVVALVALLLTTLAGVAPGAVAQASEPAVLDCTGEDRIDFNPGLFLLPRQVSIDVDGNVVCVSSDPDYAFAEFKAHGEGELSCTANSPLAAHGTLRWSDLSHHHTGTSTFHGGIALTQRPGGENVVVYTVEIDSGDFAGRRMVFVAALATAEVAKCATTGIQHAEGAATLTLLPL